MYFCLHADGETTEGSARSDESSELTTTRTEDSETTGDNDTAVESGKGTTGGKATKSDMNSELSVAQMKLNQKQTVRQHHMRVMLERVTKLSIRQLKTMATRIQRTWRAH